MPGVPLIPDRPHVYAAGLAKPGLGGIPCFFDQSILMLLG